MSGLALDVYEKQARFILDRRRYIAFVAGRNSGKTFSGSVKAVLKAAEVGAAGGGLGCIAAPSFPMLEHGAKAQFLKRLDESGEPYRATRDGVSIPRFRVDVIFVTLESESRVRGPNYAFGWADELDYLADWEIWRALKGAVRDGATPQLWATSTPKGRRLIYGEWVVAPTPEHKLYRATTFDNPFIDAADYVAGLGYTGVYYRQEVEAGFETFEGAVYPGFHRETAVRRRSADELAGWRTILAVDVGTRNPTAILTLRAGNDVERHVERELYRAGMSSEEIIDAIVAEAEATDPEAIVLDPSAAAYILALRHRGLPVKPAENAIVYGIGVVTTAIADGLTIDPDCVETIAEIEGYHYPDKRRASDVPVKEKDHAMDALRYGLVEYAGPETRFDEIPAETMRDVMRWQEGL